MYLNDKFLIVFLGFIIWTFMKFKFIMYKTKIFNLKFLMVIIFYLFVNLDNISKYFFC